MAEQDAVLDFVPLYASETEEEVTARWRAWTNEGLVSTDPEWSDTDEGSMWWVCTRGGRREAVRVYDLMGTEVVAAAMPLWAWGDYLDDHALVQDIERLAATPATGEVTFTGPNDTLIAPGTNVAAVDAEGDLIEFTVTGEGGVITGGEITLPVRASQAGSAGNLGINAIVELLTPVGGVTVANETATVGGTDTETDAALRRRLLDAYLGQGAGTEADYRRWLSGIDGVGRVTVLPLAFGPGTVLGILTTATGDPVSTDVIDAAILAVDPPAFATELLTGVDLPVMTLNVRSSVGFRVPGKVRIGDSEIVSYTGKVTEVNERQQITVAASAGTYTITFDGQTTVAIPFNATAAQVRDALIALSNIGPNDVSVAGGPGDAGGTMPYVITFINDLGSTNVSQITTNAAGLGGGTANVLTLTAGSPGQLTGASGGTAVYAAGATIAQGGAGRGLAPIGAHFAARTASGLNVTIAGTVEFDDGYSMDGLGGTVALGDALDEAVTAYVESNESGGEVVLARVSSAIVSITGVHDVGDLTINGLESNLAVPSDPPQVPQILAINLVEGVL